MRLVDVLLQELDAIGSENEGLLVLAATNAPWDVDEAMLRPGRFDRVIFVPPPDELARADILSVLVKEVPSAGLDLKALANQTPMFSGADLRALVERGVDRVIDEALTSGGEPPLSMQHLTTALPTVKPSTLDWLHRVRSYIEFANQSERYDDVAAYLRSKDIRHAAQLGLVPLAQLGAGADVVSVAVAVLMSAAVPLSVPVAFAFVA